MNEQRQAYRIRQALNHGLKDISPASARRLEAARHLALSRQKQPVAQLVLAGTNAALSPSQAHHWELPRIGRQTLAILALLVGMWLAFYWHSSQYVSEIEAVDSALLSDDLPPEALMDEELLEWLIDDSSEE